MQIKKILLALVFGFSFQEANSQITFCPKGAEWHYLFTENVYNPLIKINETITYVGFSLENGDTVKRINHKNFFTQNNNVGYFYGFTDIKQKGDTIFMRNNVTNNIWQVLYNFAALPSHSWINTFTNSSTYTTTVISTNTINIGSRTVKQMNVNYSGNLSGITYAHQGLITEYFGSSVFLFNYQSSIMMHGDRLDEFLCYKDDHIGIQVFSNKGCYYSNTLNLFEKNETNKLASIYPNPTHNILNINFENNIFDENFEIKLLDVLGRPLCIPERSRKITGDFEIDISPFSKGIYFIQIWDRGKLVSLEKVMKD